MWKKNSYETLSSLWNIFKKICFTTQLTKTLQVFIHKIDLIWCLLLLMTLWREEGKLKTMRAFLYIINFDTMLKCLQNIVALKKNLCPKFTPTLFVSLWNFTIINKKCSRRSQNHGHYKVSTPVKVAETKNKIAIENEIDVFVSYW